MFANIVILLKCLTNDGNASFLNARTSNFFRYVFANIYVTKSWGDDEQKLYRA